MAVTRIHHWDSCPDASWAIFFLAGLWLRSASRWVFPLLLAEAVLIDFAVITWHQVALWEQACMSAGYWFLIAAYGVLWLGGCYLSTCRLHNRWSMLRRSVLVLLISEGGCYLISNASFYWLNDHDGLPRHLSGWLMNLRHWYLPFLETTVLYVCLGTILNLLVRQLIWIMQPTRYSDNT